MSKKIFELSKITISYFACKNNIFLLFYKIFYKKKIKNIKKNLHITIMSM